MQINTARCIVVLILGLTVGCAPLVVDYDYDTTYDFTKLKTYDWSPSPPGNAMEDLAEKRFKQAVNTQLGTKGYSQATGSPDFLIAMQGVKKTVNAGSVGVGASVGVPVGGRGSMSVGVGKSKQQVKQEGTLTLNFIDARTQALIWQGSASAELKEKNSPEEQQAMINQVIAEMLKNFPPQKK